MNMNVSAEQARLMLNRPWNDCTGFAPFLETLTALTSKNIVCETCRAPMGVSSKTDSHFYCSDECLDKAFEMRNAKTG